MAAGELNNLIQVWTTVIAALCYCYIISKFLTKSSTISRFLCFLPVNLLLLILPLNLSSIFFGGTTCFFIAWLANFKLILFAFNRGPLFSNPPIPLSQFIVFASLPIKSADKITKAPFFSAKFFFSAIITRVLVLAALIRTVHYGEYIHPLIMSMFHGLRVALSLEMLLALSSALARALLLPRGVQLEQPFRKFLLSTSVQNYWGKRWNRVVSDILKSPVYNPARSVSARFITEKWASVPAVLVTFAVSGLMHELVHYNFARVKPSGLQMCFFLLHGAAVALEIVIKKKSGGKSYVPRIISWPLTIAFVSCSSCWLFLPPIWAAMGDLRACTEVMAFWRFVFTGRLVSPTDLHCPFL